MGSILRRSRIAFDFAAPVDSETTNALSMSVIFMWWRCDESPRKFAQAMPLTTPDAHDSGLPFNNGDGRFRAKTPAILRHNAWYSSLRWSRQKESVRLTMWSYAGRTDAGIEGSLLGLPLVGSITPSS